MDISAEKICKLKDIITEALVDLSNNYKPNHTTRKMKVYNLY